MASAQRGLENPVDAKPSLRASWLFVYELQTRCIHYAALQGAADSTLHVPRTGGAHLQSRIRECFCLGTALLGAVSTTVADSLTGNVIHKLTYPLINGATAGEIFIWGNPGSRVTVNGPR